METKEQLEEMSKDELKQSYAYKNANLETIKPKSLMLKSELLNYLIKVSLGPPEIESDFLNREEKKQIIERLELIQSMYFILGKKAWYGYANAVEVLKNTKKIDLYNLIDIPRIGKVIEEDILDSLDGRMGKTLEKLKDEFDEYKIHIKRVNQFLNKY
jgi:hypothetical protein